ncbi:MAG: redoxin domain-containing protein [Nocardioidaceae bacterium]
MRVDLAPMRTFPDLALPDHGGVVRSLSELAGGDPLVVHFFRGWFCPKERAWFPELLALAERAEVAYTALVSVSVEPPEVQAALRAGMGARWPFLSDQDRTAQAELDLLEHTDTEHHPCVPTVFVLFPDLTVYSVYNGYWFWGRPSMADLWRDLREVTRAVRSDWEVPSP